jgi:hypothetical protein
MGDVTNHWEATGLLVVDPYNDFLSEGRVIQRFDRGW